MESYSFWASPGSGENGLQHFFHEPPQQQPSRPDHDEAVSPSGLANDNGLSPLSSTSSITIDGGPLPPSASPLRLYLSVALAATAAALLLANVLRSILPSPPLWLSHFAREEHLGQRQTWTRWTTNLMSIACIGFVVSLVTIAMTATALIHLIPLIPWTVAISVTIMQRPTTTSATLIILYFCIFVAALVSSELDRRTDGVPDSLNLPNGLLSLGAIIGILSMPMRHPSFSRRDIGDKVPTSSLRSPEDNLTLWQFMTVSWMSPLISRGSSHKLNEEDVWQLPYDFQHARLHDLFSDLKGSIIRRLLQANGLDLTIISCLGVLESAANLSVPLLLKKLLESIKTGPGHLENSIWFAVLILVVRVIACQASVFIIWFARRSYERARGEMITTIYAKTLTRKTLGHAHKESQEDGNNNANDCEASDSTDYSLEDAKRQEGRLTRLLQFLRLRSREPRYQRISDDDTQDEGESAKNQPATTGKILNLLRNDVYEVAQRFWEFPTLITKPLQFVLSFGLIWKFLGWPCLIGIACVVVAQLLNAYIIRRLLTAETFRRTATDKRLHATSQFVEGIRHLRWYDWQSKWLDRVLTTRQRELNLRVTTGLWRMGIVAVNIGSAAFFPVVTFFAYTYIAGRALSVEIAFPAIQLFSMLETSFKELPNLITVLLNASIALGRIEDFMAEPDKAESSPLQESSEISFGGASFAWPGRHDYVLLNLTLSVPEGLTVVFGKVGCGKTAFLQAILGELDHCQGEVSTPTGMVGYCAQLPWLQHMSIRDNILFSASFDRNRYNQVLDACALMPDLASFKNGDLSDMGENGIGLSGGQKARVALARAIYSQSKVLLLDDPLAALDHQTAESIVEKLFKGPLLQGRTVIMVTHRLDLCLHLADQMVEIEDGEARVLGKEEAEREAAKILGKGKQTSENDDEIRHEDTAFQVDEDQEAAAIPSNFVEDEHRATGGVMMSVYWTYIKAGMLRLWGLLLFIFALWRIARLLDYWFLKSWGEAYRSSGVTRNEVLPSRAPGSPGNFISHLLDSLPSPDENLKPWLLVYFSIAMAQTVVFTTSEGLLLMMIYKAAKNLFTRVIHKVSKATFRFYDVTPVGRLMNRLVSDIGMIDGGIMAPLQTVAWCSLTWITSMVVIASVTPVFLIFSVGLTLWFVYIFLRFLPTSQSLRRLEMVSLSPLMSNFGILLDGLGTIRAFKAQPHFQQKNIKITDAFQKMDHFYWSLQAWLLYRFDALSAVSTFALTLLTLYKGFSPGLTAFVLTTASQFVVATHNLCKQYGTLQMDFVSVERVIELLDLEEEPEGHVQLPPKWPSKEDDIVFDQVTLRYAAHLDPSLVDVSFRIPGGSSCAVLGRTGSGKSTMALALLATMHPSEGDIKIGAMNLAEVDVHQWRQRISFVAQDPVLFPGTLRENLDPLEQYTDAECITVLHRVLGSEWTLQSPVDGGGKNLSQGQRQLVGIGRAVLRRSPLVVLDEATASIDKTTAAMMHDVLREELRGSTVITIAHRLEAVKDANWFVRLDQGRVAEFGPPNQENLLS